MSNLLDRSSLVLTPTAFNNGEALCIKPDDGSGDFQFSRNSAATRVNAQGLVENVQILSSNLVQNPSFSDEGVQEVSNGSFSQEGSEEITNGDFSNGSTDWTLGTGWSVLDGKAVFIGSSSGQYLVQNNVYTPNSTIKLTFDVLDYVSGAVRVIGGGFYISGVWASGSISSNGTHTFYIDTSGAANNNIYIQAISGVFNGSVTNISVKEVGQDWTLGTGWSIGEDKAERTNTGTYTPITQGGILTAGNSYKVTYTVNDGSVGGVRVQLGGTYAGDYNGVGTHTIYGVAGTSDFNNFKLVGEPNFNGSITNISVKEVLQDWSVEDYGAVSPSAVITPNTEGVKLEKTVSADWRSSFLVQPISYTNGSQYKVTFKLKNGNLPSGGSVFVRRGYDSSSQNIASTLTLTNDWVEYTYYFVADSNSVDISFGDVNWQNAGVGQYFYIDDVTLIEITDDTNLPRISYENFSYQDALGSEEISNGSFDTDTKWTTNTGWTISDGSANCDGTQSGNATLVQQNGIKGAIIDFVVGKTYKVNFDIVVTSGWVANVEVASGYDSNNITTSGNHTTYITAVSTNNRFTITANPDFIGSIDNVSVKEYLGQSVVPNSGCGSWLWEPQSTNLIPYSNDYSGWSKNGVSVLSGFVSPDGTTNASKITATSADPNLYKIVDVGLGKVTFSFYAKADEPYVGRILFWQVGTAVVYGTASHNFTLSNDWQRYEATIEVTTAGTLAFRLDFPINNGANVGEYGYLWGAQVEQQSYATSYIPTSGSTVTRNQDVCANGGSLATINSTEGTLYFEGKTTYDNTTSRRISLSDGSTSNRVSLEFDELIENKLKVFITRNGASEVLEYTAPNLSIYNKIAIKWKANDFAIWFNGSEVVIVTIEPRVPVGLTELSFDGGNNANNFYGKTKALAVWKEALSDQNLADLTYPTPTDPTFTLDFDTIAEQFTFARGSEATYVDAQGLIQSTNEIGEELVVNGDFATDSDWSLQTGWSISGGSLNVY